MSGFIRLKEVLLHPFIVVHGFGWMVLFRCVLASIEGRRTTFLELVSRRVA